MNIKKIKNATDAKMDILKQKMKNVFFAVQIKLEVDNYNEININDRCYNCRMETSKGCSQCDLLKKMEKQWASNVQCAK